MRRGGRAHGALAGVAALLTLAPSGPALAGVPAGAAASTASSSTTSTAGAGAANSPASMLLPAAGDVFTGISGDDAAEYENETGKHPAIFGSFIAWGHPFDWAFTDAAGTHARVMLHISTAMGGGPQAITPQGIADGGGDGYLLSLAAAVAEHGAPVYIRLLPEMNNASNPYSADSADGSPRGAAYSHRMFKQAWRRVVTILRGGGVGTIDAKLAKLHLPPVQGISATASIPKSPVAFIWCPETAGTPTVPSQSAASYWPGKAYVDWVGTDFYSQFPNFGGLSRFYEEFRGKPFVFAEWAMWDSDSAAFVDDFFHFVNSHKRVKMILYNEGYGSSSPLLLSKYPAAASAIRGAVASTRYLGYTPEWQASS